MHARRWINLVQFRHKMRDFHNYITNTLNKTLVFSFKHTMFAIWILTVCYQRIELCTNHEPLSLQFVSLIVVTAVVHSNRINELNSPKLCHTRIYMILSQFQIHSNLPWANWSAPKRRARAALDSHCSRFELFHLAVSSIMPGVSNNGRRFILFSDRLNVSCRATLGSVKSTRSRSCWFGKQQMRFTRYVVDTRNAHTNGGRIHDPYNNNTYTHTHTHIVRPFVSAVQQITMNECRSSPLTNATAYYVLYFLCFLYVRIGTLFWKGKYQDLGYIRIFRFLVSVWAR